jgi:hypothetical protein
MKSRRPRARPREIWYAAAGLREENSFKAMYAPLRRICSSVEDEHEYNLQTS